MTVYKLRDFLRRIGELGGDPLRLGRDGRGDYFIIYNGHRINGLVITHPGNEVPDYTVNKAARKIAQYDGYQPGTREYEARVKELKKFLTGRLREEEHSGLMERIAAGVAVVIGLFLGLVLVKYYSLIGFVVFDEVSRVVLDISLIIFFVLVVLVWRIFVAKKTKKYSHNS